MTNTANTIEAPSALVNATDARKVVMCREFNNSPVTRDLRFGVSLADLLWWLPVYEGAGNGFLIGIYDEITGEKLYETTYPR